MNQRRIIAAFLLSPLAGSLYIVALTIFEKGLWHQLFKGGLWNVLEDILGTASMVLVFSVIGYVAEGTLGIPLLCFFRRIKRLTLPWFLLGGVVIGIVVSVAVSISFWPVPNLLGFSLVYCIAPAIISTGVFWFIGSSADNKALQLTAR